MSVFSIHIYKKPQRKTTVYKLYTVKYVHEQESSRYIVLQYAFSKNLRFVSSFSFKTYSITCRYYVLLDYSPVDRLEDYL